MTVFHLAEAGRVASVLPKPDTKGATMIRKSLLLAAAACFTFSAAHAADTKGPTDKTGKKADAAATAAVISGYNSG